MRETLRHRFPLRKLVRSDMPTNYLSPITPVVSRQLLPMAYHPDQVIPRTYTSIGSSLASRWAAGRRPIRMLIRPQPGYYVMRLRSGAPLVPAVVCQLCPMVIPQPLTATGPHPDDWCRPLDRSPHFEVQLDGRRVDLDRVWTARSLRPVSRAEFEFRTGPLRRWARENPGAPEARPHRTVNLNAIPPLF